MAELKYDIASWTCNCARRSSRTGKDRLDDDDDDVCPIS